MMEQFFFEQKEKRQEGRLEGNIIFPNPKNRGHTKPVWKHINIESIKTPITNKNIPLRYIERRKHSTEKHVLKEKVP